MSIKCFDGKFVFPNDFIYLLFVVVAMLGSENLLD